MSFIRRYPWVLPFLVFALVLVIAANMHSLWGDEAESALFGKSILTYGVPYGWDGVNIMGLNDAVVLNQNLINHTSPWAQYYAIAISFLLFGQTDFTARLPFILLSLFSFPIVYYLALSITKKKQVATIACIILALSPAYILFAYQARYYAFTTLCSLLLVYAVFHLREKNWWPKILFVLAAVLFYYSNYAVFAMFSGALFVSFVLYLFAKKEGSVKKFVISFISLSLIAAVFCLPWYLLMHPSSGRGSFQAPELSVSYLKDFFQLFYASYYPFNLNNGLPALLLGGFIASVLWRGFKKKAESSHLFLFFIVFFYLLFMTILTAISMVDTAFVHNRYTMNIFPFLSIIVAVVIVQLWQWKKWAGIIILVAYLTTNIFSLYPFRSLPLEFVGEILHPNPSPDKVVADYLATHANDGDTAFVSLDRDHEPLVWHLGKKIRFVNRITPTNPRVFPKNRDILPGYLYFYFDEPDWIIRYSKLKNDRSFLVFDMREEFPLGLSPSVNLEKDYEEIPLPIFFADESRPEIEFHWFSKETFAPDERVFIYRKKQI